MHAFAIVAAVIVILVVLLDAFETVVLPRRVRRQFRITSWFYRNTWVPWAKLTSHIKSQTRRETALGYFGPLSMIALLGLWACGLIFGFALLQFGGGEHLFTGNQPLNFRLLLYHSGEISQRFTQRSPAGKLKFRSWTPVPARPPALPNY